MRGRFTPNWRKGNRPAGASDKPLSAALGVSCACCNGRAPQRAMSAPQAGRRTRKRSPSPLPSPVQGEGVASKPYGVEGRIAEETGGVNTFWHGPCVHQGPHGLWDVRGSERQCKVQSAECGVRSAECRVQNAECRTENPEPGDRNERQRQGHPHPSPLPSRERERGGGERHPADSPR